MIRVLIADDNSIIRHGLRAILHTAEDLEVVGEAATGTQAIRLTHKVRPDVVLLDVSMPVTDGLEAAETIARSARVLMLTYSEDHDVVVTAIQAGASGYLVHGSFRPEDLVGAVRDVMEGRSVLSPSIVNAVVGAARGPTGRRTRRTSQTRLTERQHEVMDLVAQGWSNASIAAHLSLSQRTVKNHINEIYGRLGVRNRTEAMSRWLGLTSDGDGDDEVNAPIVEGPGKSGPPRREIGA